MNPIVTLKNIDKKYGSNKILNKFNMELNQGEIIALFGPSGIGKSTILRMIAGLERPDSGVIKINTSHIGFVFQEPRLLPWDTVLDNIILPLRALNINKEEATKRASYLLDCMELDGCEKMFLHQLSGGMCQRVSIARALAIKPKLLLLDEAFTGLDKKLIETIKHFFEAYLNSDTTIIQVTHNPLDLLNNTNRTIELEA